MSKKVIIAFVILALVLISLFAVAAYKKSKLEKALAQKKKGLSSGKQDTATFPLEQGMFNSATILELQVMLNKKLKPPMILTHIDEDGDYGPQTAQAADLVLGNMNGHIPGKVTFAEFNYLKNKK